jgi:hypothetical protein
VRRLTWIGPRRIVTGGDPRLPLSNWRFNVAASVRLDVDLPQTIPAGRGVLGQVLDLVAPGGDGGREVGHVGRSTAERLLKREPA